MATNTYTESDIEKATLEWLEELGYEIIFGPSLAPPPDGDRPERQSYADVVLVDRLRAAIKRINRHTSEDVREDVIRKVLSVPFASPSVIANNYAFHKMLRDGVDVEYRNKDGDIVGDKVYLIDQEEIDNNDWIAVNQFTIIESNKNRRPDIIVFVNGLPIALFELKNPADEGATVKHAYNQVQTYKKDIPSLFAFNELCVIGDGLDSRLGSLTSDFDRFMKWRSMDGKTVASPAIPEMEVLLRGVFDKRALIDLIENFAVYESDGETVYKKIAAYHQYYATNKAVESTLQAASKSGDRRCGVVWHTQGSGKSLTMVFYAGKLIQAMDNPTLVVLTDRNDLDDQLFGVFSRCKELLRQDPAQAEDREQLKNLLRVASGGVVFTTIQKFFPETKGEVHPLLSDRRNIVVIADEAHRSQYDFIDGFARHMRDALPNASFIGFTGTPIEMTDANTRAVFGQYIDVYDIARAVEDHATVPIYYEARLAKIKLVDSERPKIDSDFEELMEGEEMAKKENLKSRWAKLEAMMGAEKRIQLIAKDIVDHFENRLSVMEGKGMVVVMSRRIAVELYSEIVKLRPQWHSDDDHKGFLKAVITGAASDPLPFQSHIRNKKGRELMAKRMRDPEDELKIAIVRDMWLTGFDVPSLHTMYVDKPMKDHGLMQAIARVNRVYKDKQGGLIVDYIGIAPMLKEALAHYADGDREKPTIPQEEAVSVMLEKYEIVRGILHGFDYARYFSKKATERTKVISEAIDFVLGREDGKQRYLQAVTELSYAFSLSVPNEEAMKIRDEVGLFQAVRAGISKLEIGTRGGPSQDDYDHAIRQIVSNAIASNEVIDIFRAAGMEAPNVSVLSDEFLEEVKHLEHKNIAFELLKRLLNDEVVAMERKYLVKSRSFATMLEDTIRKYQNRTLEAAQVIAELVKLAKQIREEKNRGGKMNLTENELAFYDALCVNESAVLELGDETLRKIAQELVVMLRKNTTIDWTLKESIRAKLRVYVKRLLNKYKYPPDKQESATRTVLEQAEILCRDWAGEALSGGAD